MTTKNILRLLLLTSLFSGTAIAHGHHHDKQQTEAQRKAASGIFEDKDVKDRKLSDWDGVWQSVEPYLTNGTLDPVMQAKAEKNKDKTVEEYRTYYTKGYKTDVDMIGIENNIIEFHRGDKVEQCEYTYSGYRILTYTSGKKGVRYLFECKDKNSHAPKFIQFSDHIISPEKAAHFHLYMGNESHEALLVQLDNWPTYYPYSMNEKDIVHEMLYH
ncbi:Cadmium-induced protein ZinT [Providencia rustigianii]|uniref:YodA n=2 Tax=Providencia rustigianii TaxID=158850 RepID=D1P3M7_9GAMM|nr:MULTISPECIES: metal-binding protein ZinT [Providencia]EFB72143.1 YodA [Providencia rustigianii DSM 4541]MTC55287.1 metal-binding protein ZinT [Providencia rustigianii]SPY78259.1 Cadmium-induced protein ZinT [Providencia rustigianii]SUC27877.1 Cadmium-induced protein ZinT [Providencia rustigianii]SUC36261.1 Cadmium-induced protein ZinT [Providencia rustigianii]